MNLSDPRNLCLDRWLQSQISAEYTLSLISGDASFRRYFRVGTANTSMVAVDSPPDLIPVTPFVTMAHAFAKADIKVPTIIAVDTEQGFMLLEDLGDTQLGMLLNEDNVKDWYQRALELLLKVVGIRDSESGPLPLYDAAFVQLELAIFSDWFLERHLDLDEISEETLNRVFHLLTDNAEQQPKGGMHRDFHSRNLMVSANQLNVIDFQDAVLGPITYDAVSLLRDCYVKWDSGLVDELRNYYLTLLRSHGLIDLSVSGGCFERWFDLMGLQRHLKAVGIFARLHHRDGKSGYLKDIPLTLEYIVDISNRYQELHEFRDWLVQVIIPRFNEKGVSHL